jgi:opacity protein-like surface antigen
MMKKLVLCAVFLAFSTAARTQDYPKVEAFGGYSFDHSTLKETPTVNAGINLNGGTGSISFNPNRKLGLVAEIGGYHGSPNLEGPTDLTKISYLFGPKVTMRSERLTPFAHALFGGVHESVTCPPAGTSPGSFTSTATAFGMALGGGFDVKVHKNIAVRLFQLDYVLTKFKDNFSNRQNGVRISTGAVFRFGS